MSDIITTETKTTAVATAVDRFAAYAAEVAKTEEISGTFITFRGGMLQYNKQPIAGNRLDVIVADAVFENVYYDEDFDIDNPASPVCYAFGRSEDELAPHPKAEKPQHPTCKGCPMNEFGTAAKGKGKACKNTRRLAVLPAGAADLTPDSLLGNEVAYIKLPVTSVKNWSTYVNKVNAAHRRPPFGVVTEIRVAPDPKTQFKVNFETKALVGKELADAVFTRHDEQVEMIAFPYPANRQQAEEVEKPAAKGKKKF